MFTLTFKLFEESLESLCKLLRPTRSTPVVVRVGRTIAALNLTEAGGHLGCIQAKLLQQACDLDEMESQHGQAVALGGVCKPKDVKLPIVLCILHAYTNSQDFCKYNDCGPGCGMTVKKRLDWLAATGISVTGPNLEFLQASCCQVCECPSMTQHQDCAL